MLKTKEEYANLYEFVPKERLTREAFANMLDLIESLRAVARAAKKMRDNLRITTNWSDITEVEKGIFETLDALPAWVLEEADLTMKGN